MLCEHRGKNVPLRSGIQFFGVYPGVELLEPVVILSHFWKNHSSVFLRNCPISSPPTAPTIQFLHILPNIVILWFFFLLLLFDFFRVAVLIGVK
jgi:hypothetical protein